MKNSRQTLRLSGEDVRELQRILLHEHEALIRTLSNQAGCGRSPEAIEACRRRSRVQFLLECLDGMHTPQVATSKVAGTVHFAAAA